VDIGGLIPSFGGFFWTVVAFALALSIIVAVHEFGHYIAARWSGIHAEVFSIGFGPRLLALTDRRGTRWQLALLPLGGYVRFLGDGDAASVTAAAGGEALDARTRRATMQGAPLWARAVTVAAGPAANFLLAIVVFAAALMAEGVATETPVVGHLRPLPQAVDTLRPGDRILALGGIATPDNAALGLAIEGLAPAATVTYRLLRDGAEIEVTGPFPFPPLAESVQPDSAAQDAGLRPGDVILAVDDAPIAAFAELRARVGDSGGKPLGLEVWRAGTTLSVTLTPRRADLPLPDGGFETRWLIGLTGGLAFAPLTRTPDPLEALALGAGQTLHVATTSLSALAHMVTGAISACNLQGPIGIAETSGAAAAQGIASFVWFLAVLSTAVGLLNLFPVPVLDGGHLVFQAWEALTGRVPGQRALRILTSVGLVLLLGLMAFALANDLLCP